MEGQKLIPIYRILLAYQRMGIQQLVKMFTNVPSMPKIKDLNI